MKKVVQSLIATAIVLTAAACGEGDTGKAPTENITGERVRQYLLEHPEIVLDDPEIGSAISRVRWQRERERAAAQRRSVLAERADVLESPLSPSTGNASVAITIIEFYDYQCAPCRASYPQLQQFRTERPGVRYIYGQLPIYGSFSILGARAAIAAHRQGLFREFHHALMTANAALNMDSIMIAATEAGLDAAKLRADMRDPEIHEYLEEVRLLAEALEVMGTPTFIIGDAMLRGGVVAGALTEELDRQRGLVAAK